MGLDPIVTVVTVQGRLVLGVMIDTEPGGPSLAVQIRTVSAAIPLGDAPRSVATVVTAPADRAGLIM